MSRTIVDPTNMWDDYRAHLVQEAQKVWQYAMTRDKWRRYFKQLREVEKSGNVSSLRGQLSDGVYQSLVQAQKRYESWGGWRWVLLAFTSVGRKVSLYHYLCFEEKLNMLSEKHQPDLNAITDLEITLLRASRRLSGGSKTRVMLQHFWDGIRDKTAEIKYKFFGIVTASSAHKKERVKKTWLDDDNSLRGEEQKLNADEVRDIRQRCKEVAPSSEPFVAAENTSESTMISYQKSEEKSSITPCTTKTKVNSSPTEVYQSQARYALLKMVIYREVSKIELIFLEASKKCVEVAPARWSEISNRAKKEAYNRLQELLSYLAPSKHVEACIYFKKEVVAELQRIHAGKGGSQTAFDVEESLVLLGYEQERGIDVLPELEIQAATSLTDLYKKYIHSWEGTIRSQDVSKMQNYAMTLALLQKQQESFEIIAETTFIQYYRILSERGHRQKMSAQNDYIIQLLKRHDQLASEHIEKLERSIQNTEASIQANDLRIQVNESRIRALEEKVAAIIEKNSAAVQRTVSQK